jgi:hypothetical protein
MLIAKLDRVLFQNFDAILADIRLTRTSQR